MYYCPYADMCRFTKINWRIAVDTKKRKLTLYRNGTIYKTYPVGIGKILTPSPRGTFRIINKQLNPGGPYGARWMGLSKKGYGIHGTNDPGSIGKLVSHGCVRMYNEDVIELFNLVPVGTVVTIV